MKQNILTVSSIACAIVCSLLGSGCGSISQTVYLNDLSVNGPIEQPPVHLTDNATPGEFHVSPKLSFTSHERLESRIDGNVYPPSNGQTTENNLRWSIPSAQYGVDCDWMVSHTFALSFGLTYAPTNPVESWGGNGGVGLPFIGKNVSGRFEIGVQWQTMWYDAHSVVVTEHTPMFSSTPETSVSYFHDINKSTPWNIYAAFTLNTHWENAVNFFGSASVCRQTLADFQPSTFDSYGPLGDYHYTDARTKQTATFIFVTPGLVFTLSPSTRLLTGARLIMPTGMGNNLPLMVAPMVQMDVTL